jgi:hypothetical protein
MTRAKRRETRKWRDRPLVGVRIVDQYLIGAGSVTGPWRRSAQAVWFG